MITIVSTARVSGTTPRAVTDFLLDPRDDSYRRWWPNTHLAFHPIERSGRPDHLGDRVVMDEYVGPHRLHAIARVFEAVPGRRVTWQLYRLVPLPAKLQIDVSADGEDVDVTHTLRIGFRGRGAVLDALVTPFLTQKFRNELDGHVRAEFERLGPILATT